MMDLRMLRQFDWLLFLCMCTIVGLGALMIYSSTFQTVRADLYLRQLQWFAMAMVVFIIILQIDYHTLTDLSPAFYFFALLLLVAVLVVGKKISGARSWFSLGYLNFQPSEIAKIASILLLSKYLSQENRTYLVFKDFLMAGVIMGVPMFLIILQPDMGTTLTFLPPLILLMFLAGMQYRLIFLAIISGGASLPFFWLFLKQYQKNRILTFIDPTIDPRGSGYQIIQSKIAVGSGQIFGKGLFSKTTQSYLDFIPEKQTDFVFSILAENFGLIGVLLTLGIYFLLIVRILNAAKQARDRVGTFVIMGILAVFLFHILVNIGMVIGLMPITGLPLPLMSYGGSSLLSTVVGLAIIVNIRMRRFVN
jgi:rod shape determining protein RodA